MHNKRQMLEPQETPTLPPPSFEQQNAIETFKEFNVRVQSVAGSGKTTYALHNAIQNPTQRGLLLVYNNRLKLATKEKVRENNLTDRLHVHSFHGFCVRYYGDSCYDDVGISHMLDKDPDPISPLNFDYIILDECQDLTPLYYRLFCKLMRDNRSEKSENARICVVGDTKQSIFGFNLADERFLENAESVFDVTERSWKDLHFTTSYRLTDPMGEFVNHCMLKEDRMITQKSHFKSCHDKTIMVRATKPRYRICNVFSETHVDLNQETIRTVNAPYEEVMYYMNELHYKPADIMILAPSTRRNPLSPDSRQTPIVQLENLIKKQRPDINIFVPTDDASSLDEDVCEGKLIFATFHATKGLERKVIIVLNFDYSFFYFNRDKPLCLCPNELYVAATRALEHLSVLHHYKQNYLPFLDHGLLGEYCELIEEKQLEPVPPRFQPTKVLSVTDMVRHLPYTLLEECHSMLTITKTSLPEDQYDLMICPKTSTKDGSGKMTMCEIVSDLTGIAIPSYFEYLKKGRMTIMKRMMTANPQTKSLYREIQTRLEDVCLDEVGEDPGQILHVANCWNTFNNGYVFKLAQIKEYNWLSPENLVVCLERLDKLGISSRATFETLLHHENASELEGCQVDGMLDCVDSDTVYEFKCVSKLTQEHELQLALYMYLDMSQQQDIGKRYRTLKKYVLFNILSNEKREIECDYATLCEMVNKLIMHKTTTRFKSDTIFSDEAMNIKLEYFQYE